MDVSRLSTPNSTKLVSAETILEAINTEMQGLDRRTNQIALSYLEFLQSHYFAKLAAIRTKLVARKTNFIPCQSPGLYYYENMKKTGVTATVMHYVSQYLALKCLSKATNECNLSDLLHAELNKLEKKQHTLREKQQCILNKLDEIDFIPSMSDGEENHVSRDLSSVFFEPKQYAYPTEKQLLKWVDTLKQLIAHKGESLELALETSLEVLIIYLNSILGVHNPPLDSGLPANLGTQNPFSAAKALQTCSDKLLKFEALLMAINEVKEVVQQNRNSSSIGEDKQEKEYIQYLEEIRKYFQKSMEIVAIDLATFTYPNTSDSQRDNFDFKLNELKF